MRKEFFVRATTVSAWKNKNTYDFDHVDIGLTDYDPAIDNQDTVLISFMRIPNEGYLPNTQYKVTISDEVDTTDSDHLYKVIEVGHDLSDENGKYTVGLISDRSDTDHWAEANISNIILSEEELHWLKVGTSVQIILHAE